MQLRLLATASDSSRAWDLRCFVREGLVGYIARDYPQYLPLSRAELRGVDGAEPWPRAPAGA